MNLIARTAQYLADTVKGVGFEYYTYRMNTTSDFCIITVPANTTLLYLNGTTGYNFDGMMVQWDPPFPDGMQNLTSFNKFNTHTLWTRRRELVLMQQLDPRVDYQLTVRRDPSFNGSELVNLHSVTFFPSIWNTLAPTYGDEGGPGVAATAASSGSNKGAIIGGAVSSSHYRIIKEVADIERLVVSSALSAL